MCSYPLWMEDLYDSIILKQVLSQVNRNKKDFNIINYWHKDSKGVITVGQDSLYHLHFTDNLEENQTGYTIYVVLLNDNL